MQVEAFKYSIKEFVYVSLKTVKNHSVKAVLYVESCKLNTSTLSMLSRNGRISHGGNIPPSEELWCVVPQVED